MILGDGQPKPAGTWDWWGKFDPVRGMHNWSGMVTFSIGVFQWQPCGKSRPGQTRKGKAVKRFTAPLAAPHEAYDAARAWIAQQEAEPKQDSGAEHSARATRG
ncbi:hypothetical protein [Deinococcus wulumuqiensis]|uniref:hypothetical protein n=1 Tax=Deinococcus wulumuqiensis TaxID=980427 RepID=UPI0013C2D231|nr:hypothetical protein [Deinococcus wulumuqiensis]